MTDREEKLIMRLTRVRKNIEDTRRLISYHKKMLKTYKRKEKELSERIEKAQLDNLFKAVKDGGCDIFEINKAILSGEFGGNSSEKAAVDTVARQLNISNEKETKNE